MATINVADKETLDAVRDSVGYAISGDDIVLKTFNTLTVLNKNGDLWNRGQHILTVVVPIDGYYKFTATLTAEHETSTSSAFGARIHVGTDSTGVGTDYGDNYYNYSTYTGTVMGGSTASLSGSSKYMRRGERLMIKATGLDGGCAYLKDLVITYSK